MTLAKAIVWTFLVLVGALMVVTMVLAAYRQFHPLPETQRAFVPEMDCSLSIENATICVKRSSTPNQ